MRTPLLALSMLGLTTAFLTGCSDTPEEAHSRPVRLMVVDEQSLVPAMELSGEVRARVESRLGFRVPGKIVSRSVETGQRVRKGQELARLDPTNESLQAEAARARLTSAQAERDLAASEYERFTGLYERGHISTNELERRRIALDNAEAQLALANSDASRASNQLAYTVLRADADGVVVSISTDVGEVVAAGQPVVQVAQDGPRDVLVDIPEDRLDLVRAAKASISIWAQADKRHEASLRELSASANPTTRTFAARYTFSDGDGEASLGQTATVHLAVDSGLNGLSIPSVALVKLDDGSGVWQYNESESAMNLVPVHILGVSGNNLLITGIAPGSRIATAGVHMLQEGQKVRPFESKIK